MQDFLNLSLGVSHAGEMGHSGNTTALHVVHHGTGETAGTSAGTVGDTHETRIELLKLEHRFQQSGCPLRCLGGEELE